VTVQKQTKQIIDAPARCAVGAMACTPSDTPGEAGAIPGNTDPQGNVLTSWGLYIGGAGSGNLTVLMADGTGTVKFEGLAAGQFLPIAVAQVFATGTDVTAILFLY
jgi:hypothetical protein